MKYISPDFYDEFKCKADKCKHSCCKGWEIDIDEETAQYYLEMDGALGERIRKSMGRNEAGYFFKLQNDRCPHLDERGLCEIIKGIGEDALCDICHLHPRFYFDMEEYVFCGLGASCEEVCNLLLDGKGKLLFEVSDREKKITINELLSELGVEYRYEDEIVSRFDKEDCRNLLQIYRNTEPIDENWLKELDEISSMIEKENFRLSDCFDSYDGEKVERIYTYILYRQIERLDGYSVKSVLNFCESACIFVFLYASCFGDLSDALRRWSEQIEYSTLNVDLIMRRSLRI